MSGKRVFQVMVYIQSNSGGVISTPVNSVSMDDEKEAAVLAGKIRNEVERDLTGAMTAQLVSVSDAGEAMPLGLTMIEALRACGFVGFKVGVVNMPLRSSELIVPAKGKIVLA